MFGVNEKMENSGLNSSVEKFKQFVKEHPEIIEAVRKEQATWQELYEDWYLLGEDDPRWNEFRSGERKQEEDQNEPSAEQKPNWVRQIISAIKEMDAKQIEAQIGHLSQALAAIQGVLSQFQSASQTTAIQKREQPPHPFLFRKD
jgi:hypothetical protein